MISSLILHIFLYKVFKSKPHFIHIEPQLQKIAVQMSRALPKVSVGTHKIKARPQALPVHGAALKNETLDEPTSKIQNSKNEGNLNEGKVFNFISHLKLPQSVLGQNFFPRKYNAVFELYGENIEEMNVKFVSLTPLEAPLNFLDKIVLQAFLKQLNAVDLVDLKKFLIGQKKIMNTSGEMPQEIDILLEFKEEIK